MKLKKEFITQELDDLSYIVPVGGEAYKGIARANKTAAFIVELLKEDASEEEITEALAKHYDAPRDTIAADVREILGVLRSINALEED